jgi:hypothetical protein
MVVNVLIGQRGIVLHIIKCGEEGSSPKRDLIGV